MPGSDRPRNDRAESLLAKDSVDRKPKSFIQSGRSIARKLEQMFAKTIDATHRLRVGHEDARIFEERTRNEFFYLVANKIYHCTLDERCLCDDDHTCL